MKFQDKSMEPHNENKKRRQIDVAALIASIAVIAIGFITTPSTISAQNTAGIPGVTPSNNPTTAAGANASNTITNSNATAATKPVDGYDKPEGHLTAIRHVFDDPSLRVQHYCKPNNKILLVCQLYDSNSPNATLIGIEYIISADQYNSLPNREKPGWHYHKIEFATNRADARFPDLSIQKAGESLQKLSDTYGKVIITWNPRDKSPAFPPQVEEVQHPFMVNETIQQPNISAGSFNQTLKY